MKSSFLCRSNK